MVSSCSGERAARVVTQYLGASSSIRVCGQCGARRSTSSRYVLGSIPWSPHDAIRERNTAYQCRPVGFSKKFQLCSPMTRCRSCCSLMLLSSLSRPSVRNARRPVRWLS